MKKINLYLIIFVLCLVNLLTGFGQEKMTALSNSHKSISDNAVKYAATGSNTLNTETLNSLLGYLGTPIDNDTRTISTSLDVGSIPGSFSVNSNGEANYSIPIYTPPGILGLQPTASINYSSLSNNGLLGVGWNLNAISTISRAPRDFMHDGETQAIELNYTDKFVLDGNRLVLKSGTYGYANSTYETEFKNFSTVTALGTSGNGPSYFKVTTINGSTLLYGNVSESRDQIGSTAYVWRLTKVTDANDNYIEYVYGKTASGETYLSKIKYTGNSAAGLPPLNEIQFVYEEKDDKNFFYLRGTKIERKLLLTQIKIIVDNESFKVYDFDYFKSNNTSFLNKITETNKDGLPYNATTINWNDLPTQQLSTMASSMDPTKFTGDFDGDGLTDYVNIEFSGTVKAYYNNGDGTFTNSTVCILDDNLVFIGAVIADFNSDGKEDLACVTIDECTWEWAGHPEIEQVCQDYVFSFYKNTGTGFSLDKTFRSNDCDDICGTTYSGTIDLLEMRFDKFIMPGDFNGDGYSDVIIYDHLYLGAADMSNMTEITNIGNQEANFAIDINGDGKTDYVTYDETTLKVSSFNGSTMDLITQITLGIDRENIFFGDFNGDGQSDLLYFKDNDWKIRYGAGNSFAAAVDAPIVNTTDPSTSATNYLYCIGDVDGNGKDDIIELYEYSNNHYINVFFSNGNNSFTLKTNTPGVLNFDRNFTILANLTKDGQLDLIFNDSGVVYSFYPYNNSLKVSSIMDGIGIKTEINYGRLTDNTGSFYTENATVSFPLNIYTIPLTVVTSYTQTSTFLSEVEINNVSLKYENAVLHNQGGGFLGFKKVTRTHTNGNKTINEFAFDQPLNVPYLTKSQSYFKNTLLSTNNISKGYKQFTLSGGKNYFFYTSTSSSTDALNSNTTTTVNTYDANANLTKTKSTANDGSYTEVLPSSYVANGSYHPRTVVSNRKHKDDANVFSSTNKYTYNSDHNLTQVIENYGKSNQVTTVFTDAKIDIYGNPTEIKQTPTGMNTVTTTLTYDATKRFVASKTITNLGTEYFTYDDIGNLLTQKDIYGNTITNIYDGWGRISEISDELGNTSETELAWVTGTVPAGTIFTREVSSNNGPTAMDYVDYAGRSVKSKSEGFGSKYYYTDTEYNNRQLVSKQSNVYEAGGTAKWNTYSYYDATDGRLKRIDYNSGTDVEYVYAARKVTEKLNNKSYVTEYDATGNVTKIINPVGSVVEYDYYSSGIASEFRTTGGTITNTVNSSGFITASSDPCLGNSTYTYNATGALTHSEDGKGNEFSYAYTDALNRITDIDNDNTSETYNISYVTTGNGKGQVKKKEYTDGSLTTKLEYTYDSRGRVLTEKKTIGTKTYTLTYTYASNGKLWKVNNSAIPKTTEYVYNTSGFLTNIKYNGGTVWTLLNKNLTKTEEKLGSYITLTSNYDEYRNPVSTVAGSLLNLTYNFNDVTGNLDKRTQGSMSEDFNYDDLNRLTDITGHVNGTDVEYDANVKERIFSKSDAGNPYEYDAVKKYQLEKIQNPKSALSGLPDQNITYTSFNKVKTITQGNYVVTFWYGPNQERCKMEVKQNGSELYTKYYFGNYEIKEQGGAPIEKIFYLTSPTGMFGFNRIKTSPSEDKTYFVLKDYLGSIMAVTSSTGTKLEEYSYDAWGRRRNASNWTFNSVPAPTYTTRGYTGHEHIEEVGLINMNGRVYDPLVGLFLSPDPFVQSPYDVLNYNRYSYVGNNPLKYSDPSGYFKVSPYTEFIKKHGTTGRRGTGNSDMSSYQSMFDDGNYSYNWITGEYENANGGVVSFWEVNQYYVKPNSTSYIVYQTGYRNDAGKFVGNGNYGVIREGTMKSTDMYPTFSFFDEAKNYTDWLSGKFDYSAANSGGDGFNWNGLIPVAISLNGDLDLQLPIGGVDFSAGGTLILRGKDQWKVVGMLDSGSPRAFGLNFGAGAELYIWFYTGDIKYFTAGNLEGPRTEVEFGFGQWGGGFSIGNEDSNGGRIIGVKIEYSLIPMADFLPKVNGGVNYGSGNSSGTIIYGNSLMGIKN